MDGWKSEVQGSLEGCEFYRVLGFYTGFYRVLHFKKICFFFFLGGVNYSKVYGWNHSAC